MMQRDLRHDLQHDLRPTRQRDLRWNRGGPAGFTLLELVIALSLTALATGVAASALWAARRTAESQTRFALHEEAGVRWRALLLDMLRHPPSPERVDEPLLTIQPAESGPVLRFLSQGVQEPFGTGAIWAVTVREDSLGVLLEAAPLDPDRSGDADRTSESSRPSSLVLTARIPATQGLDIQVLESGPRQADAHWRNDWPLAQTRPSVIAMRWHDRRAPGQQVSPFLLRLDPLSSREYAP